MRTATTFRPMRVSTRNGLGNACIYYVGDHVSIGSAETVELATLFAAAPDLLAACKAARTYLDQVDTDDWPPALDAMLTAAIARAEAQ
jgi:hypothetical protein